jgi:hypothetical protein
MCPLKAVLGDYEKEEPAQEEAGTQEQVAEEE